MSSKSSMQWRVVGCAPVPKPCSRASTTSTSSGGGASCAGVRSTTRPPITGAGNSRASYTTDLRRFAAWCADNRLRLLDVRRAHLETFARTMKQQGRMRSTVARRSSTRCSFYRYCHLEASGRALPLTVPQAGHGVMSASPSLILSVTDARL